MKIPDSEELAGTYWSLLFVEGVPDDTRRADSDEKLTLSIFQVIRYGIQIVTEIGDTGTASLAFNNTILNQDDHSNNLEIDVENTGSIWLRPFFSCTLFDLLGTELAVIEGGEKRLYPGTSTKAVFKLPVLKTGKYRALVIADGGGDNLFGANYTLELEE